MNAVFKFLIIAVLLAITTYFFVGLVQINPPRPTIIIEDKKVESKRGTYCWNRLTSANCVDSVSPPELVADTSGYKTVTVPPRSRMKIAFKKEPDYLGANKWFENGEVEDVQIKDNTIILPSEKGIYIFDIFGSWEKGSASYAFKIEVR